MLAKGRHLGSLRAYPKRDPERPQIWQKCQEQKDTFPELILNFADYARQGMTRDWRAIASAREWRAIDARFVASSGYLGR